MTAGYRFLSAGFTVFFLTIKNVYFSLGSFTCCIVACGENTEISILHRNNVGQWETTQKHTTANSRISNIVLPNRSKCRTIVLSRNKISIQQKKDIRIIFISGKLQSTRLSNESSLHMKLLRSVFQLCARDKERLP